MAYVLKAGLSCLGLVGEEMFNPEETFVLGREYTQGTPHTQQRRERKEDYARGNWKGYNEWGIK